MKDYIVKLPSKQKFLGPSDRLDANIQYSLDDAHGFDSFNSAYTFLKQTTFADKGYEIYIRINGKLEYIQNIDDLKSEWFKNYFNI